MSIPRSLRQAILRRFADTEATWNRVDTVTTPHVTLDSIVDSAVASAVDSAVLHSTYHFNSFCRDLMEYADARLNVVHARYSLASSQRYLMPRYTNASSRRSRRALSCHGSESVVAPNLERRHGVLLLGSEAALPFSET